MCHYDRPLTANIHAPLGREVTQVYAKHLCSKSPNGKFKYLNTNLCELLVMHADEIQKEIDNGGSNYHGVFQDSCRAKLF